MELWTNHSVHLRDRWLYWDQVQILRLTDVWCKDCFAKWYFLPYSYKRSGRLRLRTHVCFRLKTHTFRRVFAYRPHYNDRKTLSDFIDNAYISKNAVQSGDIWKRNPIVLVWMAKTLTSFTLRELRSSLFLACAEDCCSVLERNLDPRALLFCAWPRKQRRSGVEND